MKWYGMDTNVGNALSLPSRERGLKSGMSYSPTPSNIVAPFAGAWIEIALWITRMHRLCVAPFAGAWIEMHKITNDQWINYVAPFAGAWIEIAQPEIFHDVKGVAPFAGAWIEIPDFICSILDSVASLPSRERGLKFYDIKFVVDPLVSLPSRERGLK